MFSILELVQKNKPNILLVLRFFKKTNNIQTTNKKENILFVNWYFMQTFDI